MKWGRIPLMNRNPKLFSGIALILAMACLTACSSSTSIADINRDPARFTGKEITIRGQASGGVGLFGSGVYQVEDSTGSIMVVSQNFGLPANGAKVSVTGQVQQGFSFGGKNYGVVFRQTKATE
jgi:hypothetical protein